MFFSCQCLISLRQGQSIDEYVKDVFSSGRDQKIDDILVSKVRHRFVDKVIDCLRDETKTRMIICINPIQFWCYTFIPKNVKPNRKYPLIVLPHSGIHADFSTYYAHIVRELVTQGYIVVSAEYRGSTGYGRDVYENIDYGGLENEDVLASRDYMVENYDIVDSTRVAVIGWSHGGMISLMNILKYPAKYKCAFAGVPVSDLESRLTSHDESYEAYFKAEYHIGEGIKDNPAEYKRRSPSYYASQLERPLLIHTNTNDNDVYVEEVICMIDSLKAHKKQFEYKIFENSPGGHGFDRIDTKVATDIRFTIYKFLET